MVFLHERLIMKESGACISNWPKAAVYGITTLLTLYETGRGGEGGAGGPVAAVQPCHHAPGYLPDTAAARGEVCGVHHRHNRPGDYILDAGTTGQVLSMLSCQAG